MTGQRRCFHSLCGAVLRPGAEVCSTCGREQPSVVAGTPTEPSARRDKTTGGLKAIVRIGTRSELATAAPLVLPDEGRVLVGRGSAGEIGDAIDHEDERFRDVSRKHLWLHVDGYQVEVTDISSLGTYVDDVKLPLKAPRWFPIPLDIRMAGRCWMRIERTS